MQIARRGVYEPGRYWEFDTDEAFARKTFYIGNPDDEAGAGAQAWLIEYRPKPGGMIKPHFHKTPQFQVVLGGGGRLGKRPVRAGSFQFADAYTPYGPIVPATQEEGIDFYTLRASVHPGTYWMPTSRSEMKGRHAGRNLVGQIPDGPLLASGSEHVTLIEPYEDGLAALLVRLGPDERASAPDPSRTGGEYLLVARGSLRHEGAELGRDALVFVASDEESPVMTAGSAGADVLVIQYPRGDMPSR